MNLAQAQQTDASCGFTLYGRTPLLITRGEGMYCWDDQGRGYLDFCSGGRAVNGLGHCHPAVVAAIRDQAGRLLHVSNDYYTEPMARLQRLLTDQWPGSRVFLCNSGAEAIEASIKLARVHAKHQSADRVEVVTTLKSFHGRTFAAITATGQPKYQQGFEPLVPGFQHVPFNDLAAMDAVVTDRTCAVLLEPVQGESGVYPATPEYLAGVRRLCDERGAVLILDEVQTGLGRTGSFFAWQRYGVEPDIMALAKALGGGVPAGAMLARLPVAASFRPGHHASTFGGTAIAAAAACAAITAILEEDMPGNAARIGAYLQERVAALQAEQPVITAVRTAGCMCAIDLAQPIAGKVKDRCQADGLLFVTVGDSMLRLLPAMICTPVQVDDALTIIARALRAELEQ